MAHAEQAKPQHTRSTGIDRSARAGLIGIERLPLRLLDTIAIILLAITGLILFLVLVVGRFGTSSQEGIVDRDLARSIVFRNTEFDAGIFINASSLVTCGPGTIVQGSAIALVIDHSSSMNTGPSSYLGQALTSAQGFVNNIPVSPSENLIAVVQFDHQAQIISPLSSDKTAINQAISSISGGGDTAIDAGIRAARQALTSTSGKQPLIVLLTDGESDPITAMNEATLAKNDGIRIFTIALGSGAGTSLLQTIASPGDAYSTLDPQTLPRIYNQIGNQIGPVVARDVKVRETYDPDHFTVPAATDPAAGVIDQTYLTMTDKGHRLPYTVTADRIGWWNFTTTPGTLSYVNCDNQPVSQALPLGPRVLVMPPLLWLLLPFLIPLFWLLFRLFYWYWKHHIWTPPLGAREPRSAQAPTTPPLSWSGPRTPWQPEPTLVIGLGGTGRWVLTHLKRNLLDAGGGAWRPQVQLVALDTAAQEYVNGVAQHVEFAGVCLDPHESLVVSEENLNSLITQVCQARPEEFAEMKEWFPACDYMERLGPAAGNLAHGTGGRRLMGRISIFRNLKNGLQASSLWQLLTRAVSDVRTAASEGHVDYQRIHVLIVGSLAGGFGSGTVIDVAYLARRACEASGLQFTDAEISLFLVGNAPFEAQTQNIGGTTLTHINTRAALREVERFLLSRNRPFPMHYTPTQTADDQVLHSWARNILDDCWLLDGERGQYSLATNDIPPERGLFPMLADAMTVLLDTNAQSNGAAIGALRRTVAGRAQTLQLELGQGVFSSLGAFTYRLPMRDLISFLKIRFAQQLIALLLAGDANANLADSLDVTANQEAAGTPPNSYARNFLAGKTTASPAPLPLTLVQGVLSGGPLTEQHDVITDMGLRSRKEGRATYLDLEARDFARYLHEAVGRLLNGNTIAMPVARAGKLAYTQAFLTELARLLHEARSTTGWERQRRLPRFAAQAARVFPELMQAYIAVIDRTLKQLAQQEQILRKTLYGNEGTGQGMTCVIDELRQYEAAATASLESLYVVSAVRRYLLIERDPDTVARRRSLLDNWYITYFQPHLGEALTYLAWQVAAEEQVFLTAQVGDEPGIGLQPTTIPSFTQALLMIADHAGQHIWQREEAARLMNEALAPIVNDHQQSLEIHQRSEPVLPYIAGGLGQYVEETRWLWLPSAVHQFEWTQVRDRLAQGVQQMGVTPFAPLDATDLFSCTTLYLRDYVPMTAIAGVQHLEARYLRYYGMLPALGIGSLQQGATFPEPTAVFPAERRASEIFERRMLSMDVQQSWLLSSLFVGALDHMDRATLYLQAYAAGLVELIDEQGGLVQICVLQLHDGPLAISVPENARGQIALEVIGMQNVVLDTNDRRLNEQLGWSLREQRLAATLDSIGDEELRRRWADFDASYLNRTRNLGRFGLDDLIICARIRVRLALQALDTSERRMQHTAKGLSQ
jgi:uncharacterized protein YegL